MAYTKGDTVYVKGHPGKHRVVADKKHKLAVIRADLYPETPGSPVVINGTTAFYVPTHDTQSDPYEPETAIVEPSPLPPPVENTIIPKKE